MSRPFDPKFENVGLAADNRPAKSARKRRPFMRRLRNGYLCEICNLYLPFEWPSVAHGMQHLICGDNFMEISNMTDTPPRALLPGWPRAMNADTAALYCGVTRQVFLDSHLPPLPLTAHAAGDRGACWLRDDLDKWLTRIRDAADFELFQDQMD